jgi:hypothetical protein
VENGKMGSSMEMVNVYGQMADVFAANGCMDRHTAASKFVPMVPFDMTEYGAKIDQFVRNTMTRNTMKSKIKSMKCDYEHRLKEPNNLNQALNVYVKETR